MSTLNFPFSPIFQNPSAILTYKFTNKKKKRKKNLCHISPFSLLSFCSSKNISSITGNAENMLQNIRKMNFNRTNNLKYVLSCVFRELSILKLFPRKILHCTQIIRDARISAYLNNKFESFIQPPLKLLKLYRNDTFLPHKFFFYFF